MIITVKGEIRFIPVSTVTLYNKDNKTYPFHCEFCGNTANIIGGTVTKISPILEPSKQIPVISTCKSCKAKYIFQDSEQAETQVTVVLYPKNTIQAFYCYLGGGETKYQNKILEYDIGSVYSYLDEKPVKLPFTTICTNAMCPLIYNFTTLL